jgi:hypothetical protein
MKAAKLAIGIVALAMLMTALSSNASADTRTISPGGSFSLHATLEENELVNTWYWTATGNLRFTITDPDGNVAYGPSTSMSGSGSLTPFTNVAGQYTFTWENLGASSVSLTYTVSFMGDIHEGLSMLFLMTIIAAVIIVVVIIVVVVLVVMSAGKKKSAAPGMQQGMVPPVPMVPVGGNCPQCGTPIPQEGMFCAKCGARIR